MKRSTPHHLKMFITSGFLGKRVGRTVRQSDNSVSRSVEGQEADKRQSFDFCYDNGGGGQVEKATREEVGR